jgi:manganese transport protein
MSKSLEEVHSSVNTSRSTPFRKLIAFFGPAYMISVGYMDPGNWATDIAGGSRFGYSLLWVLVMSNIMAILLQSHCARLGVVSGKDLAQASRENFPRLINLFLYILAEIAIAACDLAEVLGMALGLHLLFPQISILAGVSITVFDSFILLFLLNKGIRKLEAFIISLIILIGTSFFLQLMIAQPAISEVASGLIPEIRNDEALYIAIGIIGATVMPHNLYLHSSLVQTRTFDRTQEGIRKAIRFNVADSAIALNFALLVNAAILILSAATFHKNGRHDVADIQDAHQLLSPMLGSAVAPVLFALALIAAGQSSTITGTLAGQVVMEGYLNIRLQPWIRRLITRLLAIIPSFITIFLIGEQAIGQLLILSQVILSMQLGFATIPLIHFVSDRRKMGEFVIPYWQKIVSWVVALIIISLNIKLVYAELADLITESSHPLLISFTIVPICMLCLFVLAYILIVPFISRMPDGDKGFHQDLKPLVIEHMNKLERIAVTVDFSDSDAKAINKAIQLGNRNSTLVLIHVLESTNAVVYGEQAFDHERDEDYKKLLRYQEQLLADNINTEIQLGFGNPKIAIPALVSSNRVDALVMGTHGHRTIKDILLGTTIEGVRHAVKVPLMLV